MTDRDPRVIGARIARRRHQLGWSQVELAERLGVSPSSVANWERGASYPKKKIGKVEAVLGISLDGLGIAETERSPPRDIIDEAFGDKAQDFRDAMRRLHGPAEAERKLRLVEEALSRQQAEGDSAPGEPRARPAPR